MNTPECQISAFHIIHKQLKAGIEAPKYHKCGCFQQAVEAFSMTSVDEADMTSLLHKARAVFQPKQYDCLGCPVCYPAIAANASTEAFPEAGSGLDLCPTEAPAERQGWPPLVGDYHVLKYRAPVAVCTLNSAELAVRLKDRAPNGLAIVGTLHTENLGIERLIKNTLANPYVRFLILCGDDTRQAIGHLPGQSLQSFFAHGIDARRRIREARGKRPVLKNITPEEIHAFRDQITLVPMIGEGRDEVIYEQVELYRRRDPGPYTRVVRGITIPVVQATEAGRLTLDPAGYFILYPDTRKQCLVVEHYTNSGLLDYVIEGKSATSLYTTVIDRHLLTRLDHAAYLGRELARAEHALLTGTAYVQDAAPGQDIYAPSGQCECGPACLPTVYQSGQKA